MSKVPVSVCIIAKNEEKHIEECLKRLMPYGFEIVVTDTGSTDRTREIAEKYADKVLDFTWVNDFSAARNFCAEYASNNWVLVLDCDEYVNSIDVKTVRILMQKFPRSTGGIKLTSIGILNGKSAYNYEEVIRFYNKNFYCFDAPIHEQVVPKDEKKREEAMNYFLMPMEVIHHGYILTPEEMAAKQKRNLDLLYAALEKQDDNPYIYFQIGQSEFMIKNFLKSAEMFEKGLAFGPSRNMEYVQLMIVDLAKTYMQLDRNEDALALMDRYAPECQSAKYSYIHAVTMEECGHKMKALVMYLKVSMLPDADALGENLMFCYKHIIDLYREMGDEKMAALFVDKYEACRKEKERIMNS